MSKLPTTHPIYIFVDLFSCFVAATGWKLLNKTFLSVASGKIELRSGPVRAGFLHSSHIFNQFTFLSMAA
jgi:hypothetical protein